MLSQGEIDSFVADGFVAVRGAVPGDVLRACQAEIWSALGDRGVLRDDPSTWREPVVRISCPETEAFAAAGTRPTALVTGLAGDVFLCHPFLVHAASWPHTGRHPRLIAQPGVALHDEFPLVPPLSPVELAMTAGS
jgi:hypothetical protein